jgi:hypothetical protein
VEVTDHSVGHPLQAHTLAVIFKVHGKTNPFKDPIVLLVVEEGVCFDLSPGEPLGLIILKALVDEI